MNASDSNNDIFDELINTGQLRLRRGAIFDREPNPTQEVHFDRIEGMLLGLAIGDALGNTSEGMAPELRNQVHGEIRDYLPNMHAENRPIGLPSDDTQLAFWTLEQLMIDSRLQPDHLAARFCKQRIFGLGATVSKFIENYKSGVPWYQCGPRSLGNGALMRIAPMLIPHLHAASQALWVDTALCAMITHNDSGSTAACVAFMNLLWQLLQMNRPPPPEWWLAEFVEVEKGCELDSYRPRGGAFQEYEGSLWRFVEEKVRFAFEQRLSALEACHRWYSGAYLMETLPSVLYILMLYGHNAEQAIIRAVNDTKDNDTIAAIVGAAVGALHGKRGLPVRWIANLSGRTTDRDDGRIFEILEQTKRFIQMAEPGS